MFLILGVGLFFQCKKERGVRKLGGSQGNSPRIWLLLIRKVAKLYITRIILTMGQATVATTIIVSATSTNGGRRQGKQVAAAACLLPIIK